MIAAGSSRGLKLALAVLVVSAAAVAAESSRGDETAVPGSAAQIRLTFAPIVKKVAPAVVNIYTRRVVKTQSASPMFDDPFFKQFFGDDSGLGGSRERVQNSLGSGVIVSADGLVITNEHVVHGAEDITVVLGDRREFNATVVTNDERTDALCSASIPRASSFRRGPRTRRASKSATSSRHRQPVRRRPDRDDGHRVGARPRQHGHRRLRGLHPDRRGDQPRQLGRRARQHAGRARGHPRRSCRAPGDRHRPASPLCGGGGVKRGQAGGNLCALDERDRTAADASWRRVRRRRPGGVVLNGCIEEPTAVAVWAGDVILSFSDHEVLDQQAWVPRRHRQDRRGDLRVLRDGKPGDIVITLVAAPEVPPRDETLLEGDNPLAGASIVNLSPAVAEELGIDDAWEGVMVVSVARGSRARRIGLKPGDLLLEVAGEEVKSVSEVMDAVQHPAESWRLSIRRGGQIHTIVLS
jgi:serine protease Do